MTDFHGDQIFFFSKKIIQNGQLKKTEFFKMTNSLGLVELIDAKDIDVAQPIWSNCLGIRNKIAPKFGHVPP